MFPSDTSDRRKREVLRRLELDQENSSRLYAHRMSTLADVAEAFSDQPERDAIMEVAGTCRKGQDAAARDLRDAMRLREVFPQALTLLGQGVMRTRTVEILLHLTKHCSEAVQREVGRRVIGLIAQMDAVDARRRVAAAIPEVESELEERAQRERYERARANRGVWDIPVDDGMARVGAEVDELSARAWAKGMEALDAAQKVLDQRDGIKRTAQQRRADVFAELPLRHLALLDAMRSGNADEVLAEAAALDAAAPGKAPDEPTTAAAENDLHGLAVQLMRLPVRNKVLINVHVPVTTLLELDNRAVSVEGGGYLPAFHGRVLLPTASLRQVAVDHLSGIPVFLAQEVLPPPLLHLETAPAQTRCRCEADAVHHPPRRRAARAPSEQVRRAEGRARKKQQDRLLQMISTVLACEQAEAQHDPSALVRAFVQHRDQSCRGIGCPRNASACELDHRHAYGQGGVTASWNLDAQSPRCHHGRHDGWTVSKDDASGVITWISRQGSTYRRFPAWTPPPVVRPDAAIPRARVFDSTLKGELAPVRRTWADEGPPPF